MLGSDTCNNSNRGARCLAEVARLGRTRFATVEVRLDRIDTRGYRSCASVSLAVNLKNDVPNLPPAFVFLLVDTVVDDMFGAVPTLLPLISFRGWCAVHVSFRILRYSDRDLATGTILTRGYIDHIVCVRYRRSVISEFPSDSWTLLGGARASFLLQYGSSIGTADCVAAGSAVALVVPFGVSPPGTMKGKSGSMSATSVGSGTSSTLASVQLAQESHVDVVLVVDPSSLVVVVGWSLSLTSTEEGLPSGPMVKGGNPGGGGTIPPGITPDNGITMMPTPGPTYQIGNTVAWSSAVVEVAEFAVKSSMFCVVVAKDPDSMEVWGPRVIGPCSAFDVDVTLVVVVADETFSVGVVLSFGSSG
jgi:hypothetical protein